MFEIIYSYAQNKFIIRSCDIVSLVKPIFIGTLEECEKRLLTCGPR